MALQTSGSISLLDVANEFGGSTPHSLSEYYGADSGVPSSGSISLSDFYGASDFVFPTTVEKVFTVSGENTSRVFHYVDAEDLFGGNPPGFITASFRLNGDFNFSSTEYLTLDSLYLDPEFNNEDFYTGGQDNTNFRRLKRVSDNSFLSDDIPLVRQGFGPYFYFWTEASPGAVDFLPRYEIKVILKQS